MRHILIPLLAVLAIGCTERLDMLTGTTLAERCSDYRVALAGLDAIRDRELTDAEADRRVIYQVFIEAKCPLPPGP